MKKDEYKCELCGKIYKLGSEKKAIKEMMDLWGEIPLKNRAIVCDYCFNKIHPEKNLELARRAGYKK